MTSWIDGYETKSVNASFGEKFLDPFEFVNCNH